MSDMAYDHEAPATKQRAVPRPDADVPGGSPVARAVFALQRSAGNASVANALDDERSPIDGVIGSGRGRPLDDTTRATLEPAVGADLGSVRVHTDGAADASARALQAKAYTVGDEVVFRSDAYQPESREGQALLAHELTHVVQQRSGPVDGEVAVGGIKVSNPSDRFEQAADAAADRVRAGEAAPSPIPVGGGGGAVQREDAGAEEEEPTAQGKFVQREEDEEVPQE